MTNPFIIGKTVYLRAPESGDEIIAATSENHPDPRENLFYALPTSIGEQKEKLAREQADPHTIVFTICSKDQNRAIGKTSFVRIDWIGRMATFYLAIAEAVNWQKGYGGEVIRLMVEYAFQTLNLNRIQLHVFEDNAAAVKIYKKNGFIIEGTLHQAMYHDGRYCNFYLMALLRSDWIKSLSKKNRY
jgi:RimJ/RimL family protein N-acetyltransferase